jgi:hypothetical protein
MRAICSWGIFPNGDIFPGGIFSRRDFPGGVLLGPWGIFSRGRGDFFPGGFFTGGIFQGELGISSGFFYPVSSGTFNL